MQIHSLNQKFDKLQQNYGDSACDAIYGAGQIDNPDICFIYMNPTARNVSASKVWTGLKAPWIGTKNIWRLYAELGLIDKETYADIANKKTHEWDEHFADYVYKNIVNNNIYITNLAKCTQADARALPNSVFREYLRLMCEEVESINPKVIISFGNQVSSVLLGQSISVSKVRKRSFPLVVGSKEYSVFPVYYPVGQGMRNIGNSIEDIRWIMERCL